MTKRIGLIKIGCKVFLLYTLSFFNLVNPMENVYEISLLLDFYGQMLTERQVEILDMHYNNDYSLGEISEQLSISRQGVYDNIKRSKAILNEFEEKLGMVAKFENQRLKAKALLEMVDKLKALSTSEEEGELIREIRQVVVEIEGMS